jgi:transcriptional regulator GlxA family with amidase domain
MKRRTVLGLVAAAPLATAAASAAPSLHVTRNVPLNVAFVIGEGANVMDHAGPWEVFQDAMVGVPGWDRAPFSLYTISDATAPLTATGGLRIVPEYAFDDRDVPHPDVIVMGAQGQHTERKIAWIREAGRSASVVMSVCTGAFLLAQTGLLDGLVATTHHEYLDDFAKRFPNVRLDRSARYVENDGGKYCCAGGITSGIELALRVVQRAFGDRAPAETAYYMEYVRSPQRPMSAGA